MTESQQATDEAGGGSGTPRRRFKYPQHQYIEIFEDAARHSKHDICLTHYPYEAVPAFLSRSLFLAQLIRPYLLGYELWKRRAHDLILVREFISVPLLIATPILWWFRQKTLFVLVHNVQMASLRRRDRMALRWLFRLGFRFVALESPAGLAESGISARPDQLLVLPLGFVASEPPSAPHTSSARTIGVIGRFRREKSIDTLLERLATALQGASFEAEVLVGCDDAGILALADRYGFRTRDTTRYEDYLDALDSVDVLILDYDKSRYFYRSSAVIADSVFRGKIVICPDYPIFTAQITTPEPVGVALENWERLPAALEKALALTDQVEEAAPAYIAFRSPPAIAERIDAFLDGKAFNREDLPAGGARR